jgi:hypothetical protein
VRQDDDDHEEGEGDERVLHFRRLAVGRAVDGAAAGVNFMEPFRPNLRIKPNLIKSG